MVMNCHKNVFPVLLCYASRISNNGEKISYDLFKPLAIIANILLDDNFSYDDFDYYELVNVM